MDRGPLRTRQSNNHDSREVQPEPAYSRSSRDSHSPASYRSETAANDSPKSRRGFEQDMKIKNKRLVLSIGAIITIIIVALFGWMFLKGALLDSQIDSRKYQAVFLEGGQVYFGKLKGVNSEYLQLSEIYYLQADTSSSGAKEANPQSSTADKNDVKLIKLGDEIHGPEDKMIISREKMLFYENLKSDSKVATSIKQYKTAQ